MNNEFKADTSTGNPTGNSRCHTLASRKQVETDRISKYVLEIKYVLEVKDART